LSLQLPPVVTDGRVFLPFPARAWPHERADKICEAVKETDRAPPGGGGLGPAGYGPVVWASTTPATPMAASASTDTAFM